MSKDQTWPAYRNLSPTADELFVSNAAERHPPQERRHSGDGRQALGKRGNTVTMSTGRNFCRRLLMALL